MTHYPDTRLFIDGAWRPAEAGRTIPVLNPATGQQIGTVAHASTEDLDAALAAAERGFAAWRATSAHDRARHMRKAAELLRSRADEIARLMTLENGKPLAQSKMEIMGAADVIDWFAGEGQRAYGQTIPSRDPKVMQITLKVPVGPVAAFTPWNFPINQIVRKLSAALAAGCSIIVKAPEETPASPAELLRAFADAGVPAGVIGLVYGVPAEISEYLIPHPVIRKISFTGSTPVGKQLAALAGLHMKRATMELGGHAPVIVAGDADLDMAVPQIATHKFRNAGQVCVSPTRFLIEDSIHAEFADRFTAFAQGLRIGDGLEPETDMGPLANERRIPALEALIQDAVDRGARLATGGRRIGNTGWFFEPTVLVDVPTEARIMNEEPFGPVAILNRFDRLDAAIAEANRLPFGLAAYGYTRSEAVAHRLSVEVEAGMMTINHLGLALPEVPFGGIKDSGYGTEGGSEALDAYFDTRFVSRKA
ncbi:NAD-dependent succinate-semialdehyde dehydrogenase [Cereibacter johrii]|uniref:Succinate semialdehyde dehydrogenase n=1 Tax=Cereibacter johrii TaxID=445629 RepID=A0ABX5J625_9RHOB|nr:NAD-dependent succinate-semialdehyde dehydrogenase [Cereibacter johrii]ODM44816.1 NAD-dependent succinate-semialdehyde dehydrogenase [Cereibacter johrii]PTM76783.1 succinate semialdehyde dehydrogenase [Cereibacter johrii]